MYLKLLLVLLIISVAASKSVEDNSASSETTEAKSIEGKEEGKVEDIKSVEAIEKAKIKETTNKPVKDDESNETNKTMKGRSMGCLGPRCMPKPDLSTLGKFHREKFSPEIFLRRFFAMHELFSR